MTTTASSPVITESGKQAIQQLWNLNNNISITLIKQSENHTFLIEQKNENEEIISKNILRLTPQDHRTREAIHSELEYLLLLASQPQPTLRLCKPVALASAADEYIGVVVPYGNEKEYFAALFEYAKGSTVITDWRGIMDDKIVESWGKSMAEFHQIISTKAVNPTRWDAMQQGMPLCKETHSGATDVDKTIRVRANAGHEASQMLLKIWQDKLTPFFESLGQPTDATYGVVHGDWNVSNFFAEDTESLPNIWVFDFDQAHKNWIAFDVAVVLHGCRFFQESGWAKGFDGNKFKRIFMDAYLSNAPQGLKEAGHLTEEKLEGFLMYREFYHAGVAVDILFQAESGKEFEKAITGFCQTVVERFKKSFEQ